MAKGKQQLHARGRTERVPTALINRTKQPGRKDRHGRKKGTQGRIEEGSACLSVSPPLPQFCVEKIRTSIHSGCMALSSIVEAWRALFFCLSAYPLICLSLSLSLSLFSFFLSRYCKKKPCEAPPPFLHSLPGGMDGWMHWEGDPCTTLFPV